MTIEDVYVAVVDAVGHFGPPYKAPLEVAQVTRDGTSDVYTVAFNDVSKGTTAGPIFTIDIDTGTLQTIPVRGYIIERIASHIGGLDNPHARSDDPPSQT